jgi:hypothetical protein
MDEMPDIPSPEVDTNDETRPITFEDSLQAMSGRASAVVTPGPRLAAAAAA